MSAIYLDPAAMDVTAGAVGEHAREVDTAIDDLESACAAEVPPSLAGWLADELHDIAVHARLAEVHYLVAALDTALRAQQIQADQSLATALPALDVPSLGEAITSYDPSVPLGTGVVAGTRPWDTSVTFVDPGPLVMGSTPSVAVGAVPAGQGVTFVDPGPLVIKMSTPVTSGARPDDSLVGQTWAAPYWNHAGNVEDATSPVGLIYLQGGTYADAHWREGSLGTAHTNPVTGRLEFT
jgi:hypothetical protein